MWKAIFMRVISRIYSGTTFMHVRIKGQNVFAKMDTSSSHNLEKKLMCRVPKMSGLIINCGYVFCFY